MKKLVVNIGLILCLVMSVVLVQVSASKCEAYLVREYIFDTPAYRAVLVSPALRTGELSDHEREIFLEGDGMIRGIGFWVAAFKYLMMSLAVLFAAAVFFVKRRFK